MKNRYNAVDGTFYDAINDIDHTKTKVRSPQTNGICERFHKTILQEFYQVTFRKKIYRDIETLQTDLDVWMKGYNMIGRIKAKYVVEELRWKPLKMAKKYGKKNT